MKKNLFAGNSMLSEPPVPHNEPVCMYEVDSSERASLKQTLEQVASEEIEIFPIVNGERVSTGNTETVSMPHDHGHSLAKFHKAGKKEAESAMKAALEVQEAWANTDWRERVAIFLRAAELISTSRRDLINAATMLGQSKTAHQAEIDSACELIDFLRFNAYFASEIYKEQPYSPKGQWNQTDYRPLEGLILAVTPFNFTAIAGNLPTCPAMLGNVVLWKPAGTALRSAQVIMDVLEEAGLPPGVINFLPCDGPEISEPVLQSPHLAGLHFTGSTGTLDYLWKQVSANLDSYQTYPRVVGETGGKDFVVAHKSADRPSLTTALIRGAFEFQGQKCSAASRAYIAQSVWDSIKDDLVEQVEDIKMGDVRDFRNFMGAVIDEKAFKKISSYIDAAKNSPKDKIVAGGECRGETGYFVRPTVVETSDPNCKLLEEEIFGPVLTVYPYPDEEYEKVLQLCDETSPYALTGGVFARDREAVLQASTRLRNAAGNFYINDKPTGSVVNQQPFGGARRSGTNDKAGSKGNVMRWLSPRVVKETFNAPVDYRYPFMEAE